METPPFDTDPHAPPPTEEREQPLGTVRAQAAPRDLPPRAPGRQPRRVGGPLLAVALVAVLGAGGFLAWHFAKGSDKGGGGLAAPAAGSAKAPGSSNSSSKSNSAGGGATTTKAASPGASTSGTAKRGSAGGGATTGGGSAKPGASPNGTTKGGSSPGGSTNTASPGGERSAVVAISSVLAFAGVGRTAAQHGDWATALKNRQATLARLGSVPAAASVKAPLGFLSAALQASIRADQQRVRCGCGAENAQDVAATTLKQRFLAGFNPLATRYLKRTYTEPDI